MLEMNSAEIFARGTLDWVTTHSKNILKIWNTTVGWSKEASLPCHIITFSINRCSSYLFFWRQIGFKSGFTF